MSSRRVWFSTVASTGFGRSIAELVLKKGEIVITTARRPQAEALSSLAAQYLSDRLLVVKLDVTQPQGIVAASVKAKDAFGRADVIVNNQLGRGLGARAVRDELLGRGEGVERGCALFQGGEQPRWRPGRLLQISSITGLIGGPGLGYYSASKQAPEGLTESLASELDPSWNIKVTLINSVTSFHTEGKRKLPGHRRTRHTAALTFRPPVCVTDGAATSLQETSTKPWKSSTGLRRSGSLRYTSFSAQLPMLNLGGAKGPRPGATLADAPHTYLDVGVRGLRYTIAYVMGGVKRVVNSAPTELSYILL